MYVKLLHAAEVALNHLHALLTDGLLVRPSEVFLNARQLNGGGQQGQHLERVQRVGPTVKQTKGIRRHLSWPSTCQISDLWLRTAHSSLPRSSIHAHARAHTHTHSLSVSGPQTIKQHSRTHILST